MKRLEGKTAIITGAAAGIGEATARLFSAEGARLVLCDVSMEPLEALAASLRDEGAQVLDVALALGVRAPTEEGVERDHQNCSQ